MFHPEPPFTYTLNLCSPGFSNQVSLARCSAAGYVQRHRTADSVCLDSYTTLTTGLTLGNAGVWFVAATADRTKDVNVTVLCDRAVSSSTALIGAVPVPTGSPVERTTITVRSSAGCNVDPLLCSSETMCADTRRECLQGVCFQATCAQLVAASGTTKLPAVFVGEVSVFDCNGVPLPNQANSSFLVSVDGVPVTDSSLGTEAAFLVSTAARSPVPMLTTLLLDQSRSVTSNATTQDALKRAALAFVNAVASNPNHHVALIAFDGSADPVVMQAHTNDKSVADAAINALPPGQLQDPDATNLYGAVIAGLREASRVRTAFGTATSVSMVSSMIVFTDGFDTARRATQAAAVSEALATASAVRIFSVGITATSDTAFLGRIATSGFFAATTLGSLDQSFRDVALRLTALTSNTYLVLLCVPRRAGSAVVSVALNTAQFPGSTGVSFPVNAAGFTSGCNSSLLAAEKNTVPAVTVPVLDSLSTTGPSLQAKLTTNTAYFFRFNFSVEGVRVSVTPTTRVYVLADRANPRCTRLSAYCYDFVFNTSFLATSPGTVYTAMVVNDGTTTTTFALTASIFVTPNPTPRPPGAGSLDGFPNANLSAAAVKYGGDVDDRASVVFFVFGFFFFFWFIATFGYCLYQGSQARNADLKNPPKLPASAGLHYSRATSGFASPRPLTAMFGGGSVPRSGGGLLDRPVIDGRNSLAQEMSVPFLPPATPVFTESQPYRSGVPFHTFVGLGGDASPLANRSNLVGGAGMSPHHTRTNSNVSMAWAAAGFGGVRHTPTSSWGHPQHAYASPQHF